MSAAPALAASAAAPAAPAGAAPAASRDAKIREQGIAILRSAAQAWEDDEDDAPTPEQVWDQLWSEIEHGSPG